MMNSKKGREKMNKQNQPASGQLYWKSSWWPCVHPCVCARLMPRWHRHLPSVQVLSSPARLFTHAHTHIHSTSCVQPGGITPKDQRFCDLRCTMIHQRKVRPWPSSLRAQEPGWPAEKLCVCLSTRLFLSVQLGLLFRLGLRTYELFLTTCLCVRGGNSKKELLRGVSDGRRLSLDGGWREDGGGWRERIEGNRRRWGIALFPAFLLLFSEIITLHPLTPKKREAPSIQSGNRSNSPAYSKVVRSYGVCNIYCTSSTVGSVSVSYFSCTSQL